MPDPVVIAALLLLVAVVESSPFVRLPIGLLLAIGLLSAEADLLPIAITGSAGVMVARLGLALGARRHGDKSGGSDPRARASRDALRARLSGSSAYSRITFLLGATPGMPATFIFPTLGAMRAPLGPALLGTLVGRTPLLALTTTLFAWLGQLGAGNEDDAALSLGVLAVVLLVARTIGLVDWRHRAETGRFRLRDPDENAIRMTTMFGGAPGAGAGSGGWARTDVGIGHDPADADMVEGEVLGEEVDADDDDDAGPPALPPTGLAPS